MEKGKGKLIEDEESDQEFNPQEQHVLEQESEEDEDQFPCILSSDFLTILIDGIFANFRLHTRKHKNARRA
jgi:hypothetical protein